MKKIDKKNTNDGVRPVITVVIPVYNAEKYIGKCLESIQRQTFQDYEVICVDDGSTDNSVEIIRDFALNDGRIKIVTQKNQGAQIARTNGYKKMKGKYLAFVDNDDFLDSDMYEKMYDAAKKNDSDVVICNYRLYPKKAKNKTVWYKPFNGDNGWRFIGGNTTPWNKLYKKSLLDKLGIDKLFEMMGEAAFGIVLASTKKISTIDEPLYNYRVGHSSVSGSYNDLGIYEKVVEWNKKRYEYARREKMDLELQESFRYGYLYYCLVLMSVAAKNNTKDRWREAKKVIKEEKFFNGVYQKFCPLSIPRRIFLRFCVFQNYYVARVVTRIVLR